VVVALKKSDLYSSLWKSCDELRGGMDASEYKDYILTLLFVKYVSDKAKLDRNSLIDVPEGGSFDDLVNFKGDKEIGDKINKAIGKLADANNELRGVFDKADFNDEHKLGKGKEMQDRLTNLVAIFQDLDFRASGAAGDDLLGDAYEYLMRHFATESGKSKGQFYTPAEVSRVMAKLLEIPSSAKQSTTVYDPTCGSGSLLLKVADESPHGLTIYGQEKDNATWALARMNMILHGNEIADIRKGDTITSPQFTTQDRLDTFDFLVANPPFSVKAWKNGLDKDYGRFEFGEPPPKNGDYAFLLHILKSLKSTGRGAVILPHGVLFRGNSEAHIRKELVRRGYIKAIIGLPANLFYGTGIPACILILEKQNAQARAGIFMVDASRGFIKDGAKNRLRSRDMHKIVDAVTNLVEIPSYSRMVPLSEIETPANDFNLNIPRYIDASEPEDLQDLHAHLRGGIPNRDLDELGLYWTAFPTLRAALFGPLRPGYSRLLVDGADVHTTITDAQEVLALKHDMADHVAAWWARYADALEGLDGTTQPSELIGEISESLLEGFRNRPLIDSYAAYEQLMSYWFETMLDDVALIMSEGWLGAIQPRAARVLGHDSNKKPKYETAHIKIGTGAKTERWVMDVLPPQYLTARYFQDDVEKIGHLDLEVGMAAAALAEFVDEHAVEEGLLWDAVGADGKVTKTSVNNRLKAARLERGDPDEEVILEQALRLINAEALVTKERKAVALALDHSVLAKYGSLSVEEIRSLVITDKWGTTVARGINSELTVLIQKLDQRLATLAARYGATLADLETSVAMLSKKVREHLEAMGVR
jgi:type I restriction enzyme M protein